jgi:predicted MPP superfamily phosphohydrolase
MQYFLNTPFELERISYNDVVRLEEMLRSRQMELLHNRSIRLQHKVGQPDGVDIYIAGVDDVSEGSPDVSLAFTGVPEDATKLLLSHNPDILSQPASLQADVILSGHTHGGQIKLPYVGAVHTHSAVLRRHEASGHLWKEQTQVFISRGVGEGIPLRFGAAPHVAYITLQAE